MSFDAGSVVATLTLDTDKFKTDLDRAKAKLDELTRDHKVRITAVFDNASVARARKLFADLDNALSRDAAQRLKSSPQGSVLGSLNSLFSPHPVSGAPTPQMSSQSGLLGRMISQPGGGGPVGSAGGQGGVSPLRQVLEGAGPQGNQSGDDYIRQVVTGQGAQNANTTDAIRQVLTGNTPGNVSTEDMIRQVVTGSGPQDTTTRDTIKEAIDPASRAKVIADTTSTGDKAGSGFASRFTVHITSMLGLFHKNMSDAGSSGGADMGKGILGGIGPAITGVGLKMGLMTAGIGTAMAVLPAMAGIIGLGMGVAMIGGLVAEVAKNSPAIKAQLTGIGTDAKQMLTTVGAPIIPALKAAFATVPALLKSITGPLAGVMKTVAPQIAGVFAGLTPIIRGLVGIMQAAAPAFGPVVEGLERLVANILPGIQMVIKAMIPFLSQFAAIFANLGSHLGQFFADAAPAIGASMKVLGTLLDLVGSLLPIVMKLGGAFATALAPVLSTLAGAVKSLLPFFTTLGTILAGLATAVLGDLGSAFTALGGLLTAIAPALTMFAKSLGIVFSTLENTGVFAIIGNAIEDLVTPLGGLISALLKGLAPILPPLFTAIGKIAAILAGGLAAAIAGILPPLTTLATKVLAAVVSVLPTVLTLFTTLAGVFTAVFVTAVTELAVALAAVVNALPQGLLQGIVIGVLALVAAFKTAAIISVIMDAISANPIILIAAAAALLVIGITELVTHWKTVWATIKSVASDVGSFLDDLFHNHIVQAILDVDTLGLVPLAQHWTEVWGNIKGWASDTASFFVKLFHNQVVQTILDIWSLGLIPLAEHWTAVWGDVKTTAEGFWNWLHQVFGTDVEGFFTKTIPGWFDTFIGFVHSRFATPFQNAMKAAWDWVVSNVLDPMDTFITQTVPGWFDTAVGAISRFWDNLENDVEVPVKFVVNDILNPMGQAFDDITNALGLKKPIPVVGMAGGGVVPGSGTGDVVPALLEPGETVVDKDTSRKWAWLFKAMGVPGYSSGGLIPNPVKKILGDIGGALTSAAWNALKQLIPGLGAIASIAALTSKTTGVLDKFAGAGDDGVGGTLGAILTAIPKAAVKDLVNWLGGKAQTVAGGIGLAGIPNSSGKAALQAAAAAAGWTGAQWTALEQVEMREAGFDLTAQNKSSGAYGMAQFINGPSEYAQYGGNSTTAAGQAVAMVNYIKQRYGNPEGAWAHEQSAGWYDRGGLITEPVIGFGTQTGKSYGIAGSGPEWVVPAGSPGPAMGGGVLANNLSIMMPEGSTLAAAFTELNFRLKVAQQQGWAGISSG